MTRFIPALPLLLLAMVSAPAVAWPGKPELSDSQQEKVAQFNAFQDTLHTIKAKCAGQRGDQQELCIRHFLNPSRPVGSEGVGATRGFLVGYEEETDESNAVPVSIQYNGPKKPWTIVYGMMPKNTCWSLRDALEQTGLDVEKTSCEDENDPGYLPETVVFEVH